MSSTPGPWDNIPKLDHDDKTWTYVIIAGDDDTRIAEVILPDDSTLIAAAPEMDGALDKLIFELDSITWDSQGPPSTLIDALEDARAVRAKARGES